MIGKLSTALTVIVPCAGWLALHKSSMSIWGELSQQKSAASIPGKMLAELLIEEAGLKITVQLGAHTGYSPKKKVLTLNDAAMAGMNLGTVALVAHQIGHLVKPQTRFPLLRGSVRIAFAGAVILGLVSFSPDMPRELSWAVWVALSLLPAKAGLFIADTRASNEGLEQLQKGRFIAPDEIDPVKRLLSAIAWIEALSP